jgi:hypothetical protein
MQLKQLNHIAQGFSTYDPPMCFLRLACTSVILYHCVGYDERIVTALVKYLS